MLSTRLRSRHPLSDADVELARESSRALGPLVHHSLRVQIEGRTDPVKIPAPAVRMQVDLLVEMAAGNAIMLIPVPAKLTTQQAAEILGVSRSFVVSQLEAGKLKSHKGGTHRRIHFLDVMAYRKRMTTDRKLALDELADQVHALEIGY